MAKGLQDHRNSLADTLPVYADVRRVIEVVETGVPINIICLKDTFGQDVDVYVALKSGASASQKMVSKWWKKAICGLAVQILWLSKHLSGVVSNMLLTEWQG
ncbi:hypothetical protein QTP88_010891 [Uroleucon formosanum]